MKLLIVTTSLLAITKVTYCENKHNERELIDSNSSHDGGYDRGYLPVLGHGENLGGYGGNSYRDESHAGDIYDTDSYMSTYGQEGAYGDQGFLDLVHRPNQMSVYRPISVQVPHRVEVPVPGPVFAHSPEHQTVEVPRSVFYTVNRPVPYAARVPVQVSEPQAYPVEVPQPAPFRVPHSIVVKVPEATRLGGTHGEAGIAGGHRYVGDISKGSYQGKRLIYDFLVNHGVGQKFEQQIIAGQSQQPGAFESRYGGKGSYGIQTSIQQGPFPVRPSSNFKNHNAGSSGGATSFVRFSIGGGSRKH